MRYANPGDPGAIGEIVKTYRFKNGLSQSKCAREAGIHRNSLVSIENGVWVPSMTILRKLCKTLEIPESLFADSLPIGSRDILLDILDEMESEITSLISNYRSILVAEIMNEDFETEGAS